MADLLERPVAKVAVEPIGETISGDEHIDPSVRIKVGHRCAAAHQLGLPTRDIDVILGHIPLQLVPAGRRCDVLDATSCDGFGLGGCGLIHSRRAGAGRERLAERTGVLVPNIDGRSHPLESEMWATRWRR